MKNKSLFLLYPLTWFIPPVHEVGHVFICWLYGAEVVSIELMRMSYIDNGSSTMYIAHGLFDYALPFFITLSAILCIITWGKKK